MASIDILYYEGRYATEESEESNKNVVFAKIIEKIPVVNSKGEITISEYSFKVYNGDNIRIFNETMLYVKRNIVLGYFDSKNDYYAANYQEFMSVINNIVDTFNTTFHKDKTLRKTI